MGGNALSSAIFPVTLYLKCVGLTTGEMASEDGLCVCVRACVCECVCECVRVCGRAWVSVWGGFWVTEEVISGVKK